MAGKPLPSEGKATGLDAPGRAWKRLTATPRPAAAPLLAPAVPPRLRWESPAAPPRHGTGRVPFAREGDIGPQRCGRSRCGAGHRRQRGGVLDPLGSFNEAAPGWRRLCAAPRGTLGAFWRWRSSAALRVAAGRPPKQRQRARFLPHPSPPLRGLAPFEGVAGRGRHAPRG